MADIKLWFPKMLKWEGGYADLSHLGDSGGCTNLGVTIHTLRQWRNDKNVDCEDVKNLTKEEALDITKALFWDKLKADKIKTQLFAELWVDWAYNSGAGNAVPPVQRILNQLGNNLVIDGIVGDKTIDAINKADQAKLYSMLWATRKQFYLNITKANPQYNNFLKGWLNRLNDYPSELPAEALKKK